MLVERGAYSRLTAVSNYFLQSFAKTKWHRGGGAGVIEVASYWSIHVIGNTGSPHPLKLYSFFLTNYYCFFSTDSLSKCFFICFETVKEKKNL